MRCAAVALVAGALACARNQETGAAPVEGDTAVVDTSQVQNPPGYRGIERDTTMVPPRAQEPVDTFIQQQGVNPRADTSGYSGVERDTTKKRQDQPKPADSLPVDTLPVDSIPTDSVPVHPMPGDSVPVHPMPSDSIPRDSVDTDSIIRPVEP
jgi:hypothetical protein